VNADVGLRAIICNVYGDLPFVHAFTAVSVCDLTTVPSQIGSKSERPPWPS